MPRFFLNIEYDDGSTLLDEDGAEFPDADAAITEARKALNDLVCETISASEARVATHIHVTDASGRERADVTIGEIVPPCVKAAMKG